ncbi:hypothetical protein ABZ484_22180 [Streptomyces sp. NPDC006393]|uniref:hypothetical protein n=1 Tax=Streptomyces sp. NPDC006393 TaxID=3156763 RepID=UPI0033C2DACB
MKEKRPQRQQRQAIGPVRPHGPQPSALVHELLVAAGTDADEARGLARRLAASLPPEARLVLLGALAEAGAWHDDDRTVPPALSGLTLLPPYEEHQPDGPADAPGCGDPASGDPDLRQAAHTDPPDGLIRLRFADEIALERAGAAFGAASGPGFGDAWSDPAALTLQIPGDAGVETLRAVLAVLDAAAVTAESLTVHTHELDDVFAAFTALP